MIWNDFQMLVQQREVLLETYLESLGTYGLKELSDFNFMVFIEYPIHSMSTYKFGLIHEYLNNVRCCWSDLHVYTTFRLDDSIELVYSDSDPSILIFAL